MAKNPSNENKTEPVKKPKKTKVIEAEEVVTEEPRVEEVKTTKSKSRFNTGQIAWGLVLIFFGVLLLLDNLGVLSLAWGSIWKLWPLIIILVGVSALDIKGWAGMLITAVVVVFSGFLILTTLTGNIDKITGVEEESEKVTSFEIARERDAKQAEVKVSSGAGKIEISDHFGKDLVKGKLTSVITQLSQKNEVDDGTQEVELSLKRGFQAWGINPANDFDITMNRNIPINLAIDTGAASIKADLEKIEARSVEVDAGASSIWLKMGNKQKESKIDIDTGASSVEINIPEDAGVKLVIDAGLSSRKLPSDLEETDADANTYKSKGYEDSKVRFTINVDMGVSSFKLVRY